MAVPSRRHKAGLREILNKESEAKKRLTKEEEKITPEEHETRLKALRDAGIKI